MNSKCADVEQLAVRLWHFLMDDARLSFSFSLSLSRTLISPIRVDSAAAFGFCAYTHGHAGRHVCEGVYNAYVSNRHRSYVYLSRRLNSRNSHT